MGEFRFRQFVVRNEKSPLKVGTDAVVFGASMTLKPTDRAVLDVGTGTGVLALMVAQRLPDCRIDALDIDPLSVQEASDNFAGSPWPDRLSAVCMDFRKYSPLHSYDLVFSNPPYFENSLINPDEREATARHTGGLSYRDIIRFCELHLSDQGRMSLILPVETESVLIRTAAGFGLYPFRILRIRTTSSKPVKRIVAEFSSHRTSSLVEEHLVLQDGSRRTAEYQSLTEEFYL